MSLYLHPAILRRHVQVRRLPAEAPSGRPNRHPLPIPAVLLVFPTPPALNGGLAPSASRI
ncbi:hypothetical protein KCP71_11155 [Salmonella enterica subsp. enterica]|nr:hypothetical protein KCP71_11155 [Salmonella enterica subsp. enterica]